MKKMIEQYFCDICKKEAAITSVNYPVIFHTDQTDGRAQKPYISQEKIDVCDECRKRLLMLDGWGAQGYNKYEFREVEHE